MFLAVWSEIDDLKWGTNVETDESTLTAVAHLAVRQRALALARVRVAVDLVARLAPLQLVEGPGHDGGREDGEEQGAIHDC